MTESRVSNHCGVGWTGVTEFIEFIFDSLVIFTAVVLPI